MPRPPMLSLPKCASANFRTPPKSSRIEEESSYGIMWSVAARRGRRKVNREDMFTVLPFIEGGDSNDKPVSIFAVFDGHGGKRVAQYASKRLPDLFLKSYRHSNKIHSALKHAFITTDEEVVSELTRAPSKSDTLDTSTISRAPSGTLYASTALQRGMSRGASQNDTGSSVNGFEEPPVPRALPDILINSKNDSYSFSTPVKLSAGGGTTATVVTLIGCTLSVAHVGDSRAVLGRTGGQVVRLCEDHRPSRNDEKNRIESAGGLILFVSGTCRVNGVLAVSRALGDVHLKDYVIAEPDITSLTLAGDEDYLIMGSDGLWDVISDEESMEIVRENLKENAEEDMSKILVQEAWDRGSNDDVAVIVVNLKKYLELSGDCSSSPRNQQLEDEVIGEIDLEKLSLFASDGQEAAIEMVTPLSAPAETPRVGRYSPW